MVDEFAEGEGNFNGIEVLALNVFDERHLGEFAVVSGAHVSRHSVEPSHSGSAIASFARDNLIGVGAGAAQRERLNDAQFANAHGKFFKRVLVEGGARLLGVGRYL